MISVIVPVYKAEKTIACCIDSVIAQDYPDWELILVDDGSPDKSGEICDEYAKRDSRIKVIHKTNGGVSSARNEGLCIAKGKYISFVDSDDYVLPSYLSDMLEYEADVVVTGYINRYEPSREIRYKLLSHSRQYKLENGDLLRGIADLEMEYRWFGPAAKLYLNSIIQEHNLRFDESMDYGEDHLFNMEFAKSIKTISYLNRFNYVYVHRETASLTNRHVPCEPMFNYIIQLYSYRQELLRMAKCDENYVSFVNNELTKYFWGTVYSMIFEKGSYSQKKKLFIQSVSQLPKEVLYERNLKLPKTHAFLREIFRVLPLRIAIYLSFLLRISIQH